MSRRLLLITGIPGTGKTTLGEYLQDKHGFTHVNREIHDPKAFTEDPKGFLSKSAGDVVATWGFRPLAPEDVAGVAGLCALGFRGAWFDGYRPWALKQVIASPTKSEADFYLQLRNVEVSGIRQALQFRVVDPFTATGDFRDKATIAKELLAMFEAS